MEFSEAVNLGVLIVAIGVLLFSALSNNRHAKAINYSNFLELDARLTSAWRNFRDATDEKRESEFGEVLNTLEVICFFYNEGELGKAGEVMLKDYLKEVIEGISNHEISASLAKKFKKSPSAFKEIDKFCKKTGVEFLSES